MTKNKGTEPKKILGVIGGMGPEATAYFYWLIIKNTKASKDQEHLHVIIDSYPQIPPRTEAILGKGPSPLPYLIESAKRLEKAGAQILVIPCITAHYYYEKLVAKTKLPIVNLLKVTIDEIRRQLPKAKKIGLIGSTGTMKTRLFHQYLERVGYIPLTPLSSEQKEVMKAIFGKAGIKAGLTSGQPKEIIVNIAHQLVSRGADSIIAACTEVPLVLKQEVLSVPLFDPMEIGARSCIEMAGYKVKKTRVDIPL
ncbi:MAG: amino acid racemase [Candidatus Aminicenantes bacterium]|nr:amino acid racemase [Candidatus Aminicenantes bacterium]